MAVLVATLLGTNGSCMSFSNAITSIRFPPNCLLRRWLVFVSRGPPFLSARNFLPSVLSARLDGATAQFSTAALPNEPGNLSGAGDLAIPIAFSRPEFVLRGGHSTELAGSCMSSFIESVGRFFQWDVSRPMAPECPLDGTRASLGGDCLLVWRDLR